MSAYRGQIGQDYLLDRFVFRRATGYVFVDVGAYDGVIFSNTLFFEQRRGWSGLCIEPNPAVFSRLSTNRSAKCVNVAVGASEGTLPFNAVSGAGEMLSGLQHSTTGVHGARIDREIAASGGSRKVINVSVETLNDILRANAIDEVHYLSIDTEGNELEILQSFDFDSVTVHAITVERNRGASHETAFRDAVPECFAMQQAFKHEIFFLNRNVLGGWAETRLSAGVRLLKLKRLFRSGRRRLKQLVGIMQPRSRPRSSR